MGCVLSEVAIWVTGGIPKLLEYRRRRQKEIAKKLGVASSQEDRFHYGLKVLQTVNDCYDDIACNSRRCDLITPSVIEKIVKAMVRPHPESRGAALFLLETSKEILKDAKGKGKESMPSGPAPNPNHTISDSGIQVRRPRLPPNLPPDQNLVSKPQSIVETGSSGPDPEQATVLQGPSITHGQASSHGGQRRSAAKPNEERSRPRNQEGRADDDLRAPGVKSRTRILPHTLNGRSKPWIAGGPKPDPKSRHPTMLVSEGLSIKKEKKYRFAKYPGEDAFHASDEILQKRDHVQDFHTLIARSS